MKNLNLIIFFRLPFKICIRNIENQSKSKVIEESLIESFISKFYQNFRPSSKEWIAFEKRNIFFFFSFSIETNEGTHAAEILGSASKIVTPSEMLSDDIWWRWKITEDSILFFVCTSTHQATTSNRGIQGVYAGY